MKVLQFQSQVTTDFTVVLPAEIASKLQPDERVRVVLISGDSDEDDDAWKQLGAEQFLNGYAESDGIYDSLSAG